MGIYPLNSAAIPPEAFVASLPSYTATSTATIDATATVISESESAIGPVTPLSHNETDMVGLVRATEHSNEQQTSQVSRMDRSQPPGSSSDQTI